ncbi:TPA: NAD(P)/FAD-dependent oxidoreductase [Streptococcus suis]
MELFDITIIGGGPVGLYTAFYAQMRQVKVKIIESLEQLGGQPAHLYPEKTIYDIPAYPKTNGQELTDQLTQQLALFSTHLALNEKVIMIKKASEGHFIIETDKQTHLSKTVILAIGNGAFSPRKLNLPEASTYEGNNLHYFVKDLATYADKDILISGGGDSAVDWALMLEPIAKSVTLIHRRPLFRAMEHSVSQLHQSKVKVMTPYVPTQILGQDGHLTAVQVAENRGQDVQTLAVDYFIVSYGFSSSIGKIKEWGIETKGNLIPVDSSYQTNIPGIFAVGDVADYPGKIRIIAAGFGEGPTAVGNAIQCFQPDASRQHIHSTSLFEQH